LFYQWQLNRIDLPAQTNLILNLTNVRASDAGFYRLLVTNVLGLTVGPEARLLLDATFTKITSGPIVTDKLSQISHGWVDYDADGDLDLIIENAEWPAGKLPFLILVIYRNEGGGVFTRLSQKYPDAAGLGAYFMTWGDYDNDGYPDFFVPNWGQALGLPGNNFLLHNERDGTFREVTNSVPAQEGGISNGAAWGDYNGDGWLDLFVSNSSLGAAPSTNWMYLNQGNGTFAKLTPEQVGAPLLDVGVWTTASWADVDDDGWLDLLVTSYIGTGRLYRNTGTGSFVSFGTGPLVTETNAWQNSVWGDYDNDGRLDVFVTGPFGSNALFRNEGGGGFRKLTEAEAGSLVSEANGGCGGAAWADYDNDGYLDLFVTKGWYSSAKSFLYHNNGDGTFTQVTTGSPAKDISYANECTWVDYDQDGFLDLIVNDMSVQLGDERRNRLYHNNGNTNHWLVVKCVGTSSPRLGTGAKVRALATIGGKPRWQLRLIDVGASSQAGHNAYAHFGLGDATNVTTLRIEWPSGTVQELYNVSPNQFLTIPEGPSLLVQMPEPGQLDIFSERDQRLDVQTSSDLKAWQPWLSITNETGSVIVVDPATNQVPRRFYRALKK